MKVLKPPMNEIDISNLQVGEEVLISGTIYTARDMAHKRMYEAILADEDLPIDLYGQLLYYTGPCPAPPGKIIGSAGPTTSNRMDDYTELLLAKGLKCLIGKGNRDEKVVTALKKYGAVYLSTIGGAGAYLAKKIVSSQVVAYEELGPEAIRMIEVRDFPAIVAIDVKGNNIYENF